MTKEEIVNCLTTDTDKAVKLPDGTLVTEKLAWEAFRREAAKDILSALMQCGIQDTWRIMCENAINGADELIKQLKGK